MDRNKILIAICIAVIVGAITFRVVQVKKEKAANDDSTSRSCFVFSDNTISAYYVNICGKDIVIPEQINGEDVKVIGEAAFENVGITSVTLPSKLEKIESYAFNNNKIKKLVIPESVTFIGKKAFFGNELTNLEITGKTIEIGDAAFNDNKLPEKQAFIYLRNNGIDNTMIIGYGGAKKDKITIPDTVETIGNYAFSDNEIENISLGTKVKSIGNYAFIGNVIKSVTIPETVEFLGDEAFDYNIERVYILGKASSSDFQYCGMQSFSSDAAKYDGKKSKKQEEKEKKEEEASN